MRLLDVLVVNIPDLSFCSNCNVLSSFVPEAHVPMGRPTVSRAVKEDKFCQELQLTIVPWYDHMLDVATAHVGWWSATNQGENCEGRVFSHQQQHQMFSAGLSFLVGGELAPWCALTHTTSLRSYSSHFCWLGRLNKLKLLYSKTSARDDRDQPLMYMVKDNSILCHVS